MTPPTLTFDPQEQEWYDALMAGMRVRKPANEARKFGGNIAEIDRKWREFRETMKRAGYPVIYEMFRAGKYRYSTYRLMERQGQGRETNG